MRRVLSVAAACLAATLFALSARYATAQDRVLATIDGVAITEADVRLADADIGLRLTGLSDKARRDVLLQYLIGVQLLAAAGRSQGLDSGESYQSRLRYFQRRALFEQLADKVKATIQTDDAKRAYDFEAASSKTTEEVRARHIQVESEQQAIQVRGQITDAEEFIALARAVSKDQATSWRGGEIGYFARGEKMPWLEKAAFALKPGEMSPPVQSEYGWHLILLEDRRMRTLAPFDEVKDRIIASLTEKKVQELIASLRKAATVSVTDGPRQ